VGAQGCSRLSGAGRGALDRARSGEEGLNALLSVTEHPTKQLSGGDNTAADAGLTDRCRGAASRVSLPASKWLYLAHRKPATPVNKKKSNRTREELSHQKN